MNTAGRPTVPGSPTGYGAQALDPARRSAAPPTGTEPFGVSVPPVRGRSTSAAARIGVDPLAVVDQTVSCRGARALWPPLCPAPTGVDAFAALLPVLGRDA